MKGTTLASAMKPIGPLQYAINQEMVEILADHGYTKLMECITSENVFTCKGRLNRMALRRLLDCNGAQLEMMLDHCRQLLDPEKAEIIRVEQASREKRTRAKKKSAENVAI